MVLETPLPPFALAKSFSRSGCGRIFPLFSGVMRVRLLTGTFPKRPESVLSGSIFSRPVNRTTFGSEPQHPENTTKPCSSKMMTFALASASKARLESEESAT